MLSMTITIMSYLDHLYFDSSPNDGGYTEYKVEIQKESQDKDMRRGMITSIDTEKQVSIKFRKKKKANKTKRV